MKNFLKQHAVCIFLLLAGVLTRLLAAWRFRHMVNLDSGVVALMAKHISEGREFPVFFYGQAHMGSLEALLSGFFCWIFGVSGFAVTAGTAVVSMGLLPCVYLWAKAAAGRRAGEIALAFCVIGPGGFFHYNGSPRGGYAAALTFGALVLMLATRMVIKWKEKGTQSGRDFFILGVAAGIAWWSSQLTTASILSAALLLLAGMGFSVFTPRIFSGLAGFFLGSLPLWWWNVMHDWQTFQFADSFGRTRFFEALGWFFSDRFLSLYAAPHWPGVLRVLFILQVLLLVMAAIYIQLKALLKKDQALFWGLGSVGLFTMVFSGFFASSHLAAVPTPRYILPLVGPLSVLFGVVIFKTRRYVPAGVSAIPILLLVGVQVPTLFDQSLEKMFQQEYNDILEFGKSAEDLDIDILYAPNNFRSWSFILREQVKVVDLNHQAYLPYAQEAEFSSDMKVMENYGLVENCIHRSGGRVENVQVGKWRVGRNFSPPRLAAGILPASEILSVRDDQGRDHGSELTSASVDQVFWQVTGDRHAALTLEFRSPQPVLGFRYWPGSVDELAAEMYLEGRGADGVWVELVRDLGYDQYYWSGPRLYFSNPYYRRDFRFAEQEVSALRLSFKSRAGNIPVSIQHLEVLMGEMPPIEWPEALKGLLELLRQEGVTRVLADRWESNQIVRQSGGEVSAPLAPSIFPESPPLSKKTLALPASGALLVLDSYAAQVRQLLKEREISLKEVRHAPWVLFVTEEALDLPGLYWNGLSLFKNNPVYGKFLWESGQTEAALQLHPYLVEPDLPPREHGFEFQHGIALRDFQISATELKPGEVLEMAYVWEIAPEVDPSKYAVFVHFYREQNDWGDDRVFLSDIAPMYLATRPAHGLYPVSRSVTIPSDAEAGNYHIRFGLYDRQNLKRLRISESPVPIHDHAIQWPEPLSVTSP